MNHPTIFDGLKEGETRSSLHALFEILPDGVVLLEQTGGDSIIVDCNLQYARMNGYEPHELIGRSIGVLHTADPSIKTTPTVATSADTKSPLASYFEMVRREGVREGRAVHLRKDGSCFPVQYHSTALCIDGRDYLLGIDRDASSHAKLEAIQHSEGVMRAIFEASPDGIVLLDPAQSPYVVYECNHAYARMNGYTRDELIGQPIDLLNVTDDEARTVGLDLVVSTEAGPDKANHFHELLDERGFNVQFNPAAWHKRKDGSIIAIEFASTIVVVDGRKMILGIDRDVSMRRRDERLDFDRNRVLESVVHGAPLHQSLGALETLVQSQIESLHCAILVADLSVETQPLSDTPTPRTLHSLSESAETRRFFHDVDWSQSELWSEAMQCRTVHLDHRSSTRSTSTRSDDALARALPPDVEIRVEPICGSSGSMGAMVLWGDIAGVRQGRARRVVETALKMATLAIERHDMAQRLTFQAEHDVLTGLPNRFLFEDRLQQALNVAQRHRTKIALLFLDLDGFKDINDSLGHQCGDSVLQEVARRLSRNVRASDTVARLSGDEFTLILSDMTDASVIDVITEKLIAAIKAPIQVESRTVNVTVSIGIAVAPDDAGSIHELVRLADSAMYRAKQSGKNRSEYHQTWTSQK